MNQGFDPKPGIAPQLGPDDLFRALAKRWSGTQFLVAPRLTPDDLFARAKRSLGPSWDQKSNWSKNMVLLVDGFEGQVGKVSRGANDSPGVWQPFRHARMHQNPPKPKFWINFGVIFSLCFFL